MRKWFYALFAAAALPLGLVGLGLAWQAVGSGSRAQYNAYYMAVFLAGYRYSATISLAIAVLLGVSLYGFVHAIRRQDALLGKFLLQWYGAVLLWGFWLFEPTRATITLTALGTLMLLFLPVRALLVSARL